MTDERNETWTEIKDGMKVSFKIIASIIIGISLLFGVAYVCINCCL